MELHLLDHDVKGIEKHRFRYLQLVLFQDLTDIVVDRLQNLNK